MPPRLICPYCRAPVDPQLLDTADCKGASCRVCPECDALIQLPSANEVAVQPLPTVQETSSTPLPQAEPCPVMP